MSKQIQVNDIDTKEVIRTLDSLPAHRGRFLIKSKETTKKLTFKTTNYGNFIIIDKRKREDTKTVFTIRFIDTGYVIKDVRAREIRTGSLKDYIRPSVYGVGFLGEKFKQIVSEDNELHKKLYIKWTNMLRRCYDERDSYHKIYGENNVTVSERWHNYSNYYYDVQKLPGYNRDDVIDPYKLTLDKDKLQQGKPNKVYSKDTCCWLTMSEQNYLVDHDKAQDSLKKYFVAIHPDGTEEICKGIGPFARKYNLDSGDCSRARNGKIAHVKGYRFRPATESEIDEYNRNN